MLSLRTDTRIKITIKEKVEKRTRGRLKIIYPTERVFRGRSNIANSVQ